MMICYSDTSIHICSTLVAAFSYVYGTRLRYAAVKVSTDINMASLGFRAGLPIRDAWEDFMTKEVSSSLLRGTIDYFGRTYIFLLRHRHISVLGTC